MKKTILIIMVFILSVFLITSWSFFRKKKAETFTMRIAHTLSPDSHYHQGLLKFAELVDEKSGGTVKAEVFHSAQLGSERDVVEGVSLGTIEATLTSTGPLPNFSKKFMVFDLPFIIQEREKAFKVMDGKMGREILDSVNSIGINALGFWENGFRMLTNSRRAVNSPADVKGLKIRLMENVVHVATFKALGAQPVPMPFGELFTALQLKTVDGQENPLVIIDTSNFYEVQKYLALTGHFYSPAVFMINQAFFDKMSKKQQRAVIDAEKEARVWQREFCVKKEKDLVEKLKAKGMTITYPDKKAFQEATQSVYDKFRDEIGADVINALLK